MPSHISPYEEWARVAASAVEISWAKVAITGTVAQLEVADGDDYALICPQAPAASRWSSSVRRSDRVSGRRCRRRQLSWCTGAELPHDPDSSHIDRAVHTFARSMKT